MKNPPNVLQRSGDFLRIKEHYLRFLAAFLAGRFAALRTTFFTAFLAGRFAAAFFLAGIVSLSFHRYSFTLEMNRSSR